MRGRAPFAHGFRLGPFLLDRGSGDLYKNGAQLERLRPQDQTALVKLLERAPDVVSKEELVAAVWGEGASEPVGGLKGIIGEIRDKLSPEGRKYVEAIPGRGYRFVEPVEVIGPGGGLPPWLIWVAIALAIALAIYLVWQRMKPPLPPSEPIAILLPKPGENVPHRHPVSGRVSDGSPVCVVIHPQGTDGYHNQPNVNVGGNAWDVDAYFGDEDKDLGRLFDIVAIAGCTKSPGQLTGWPAGAARSRTVTVKRR